MYIWIVDAGSEMWMRWKAEDKTFSSIALRAADDRNVNTIDWFAKWKDNNGACYRMQIPLCQIP